MVIPWAMHREAIEQFYEGTCDIFEYQTVVAGNLAGQELVKTADQAPCRLSFSSSPAGELKDGYTGISQKIKLFLSSEICVLPGSKIVVTQAGMTTAYRSSGKPAVYPSHQEIELSLWKEMA